MNEMLSTGACIGTERRAFIRLPYQAEAIGRISDAAEGLIRVEDISRTGLRLAAPVALEPGAAVSLVFEDVLFAGEPVALDGAVIWSDPADGRAGVVLRHEGGTTVAAASELFYAAISNVWSRFSKGSADSAPE